ncbi:MAG: hypothetical protein JNJ41_08545 [Bacteroidia bacterium]|nr:hypothetical protein [Bacteroidia bacterium]
MIKEKLIRYFFRPEIERLVFLGDKKQKGSLFVPVNIKKLWHKQSFRVKLMSILKLGWEPTELELTNAGIQTFKWDIFGEESDYGHKLLNIMAWHNCREWNFDSLAEADIKKAEAIDGMVLLTRIRYDHRSSFLNLNLATHYPFMCLLVHPMVVKIPILSLRYYLNVHCEFAFNSIRQSKHEKSDGLISYLYEILFLQQKTAAALHEYIRLIVHLQDEKKRALFTNAEIDAIMKADLLFSYLKATIEKTIALTGLIYSVENLDSKKNHAGKVKSLVECIPKELYSLPYYQFVLEYIKPEYLEKLNNYRTGLLHKKGIADLQPHNYVGKKSETLPLKKIFQVLHEQHTQNTAVLLGALAILTDELVRLDPPNIKKEDLPR